MIAMKPVHDYNISMANDWNNEKNPRWNGGKRTLTTGYIMVRADPKEHSIGKDGYILEHRLIMEKHIGRKLERGEIVHHLNHVVDDNRLENLQLYSSHAEHMKASHNYHRPPKKLGVFTNCHGCGQSEVKAATTKLCRNCYMKEWNRKRGIVKSR